MRLNDLVKAALIAAVYTVLSLLLAPISFANIQFRVAECLGMLPLIYYPAIYGVSLGCFLTNLLGALSGSNPLGMVDAIVGTSATFIAAFLTYKFRNKKIKGIPVLSILMPVILNFIFIGAELSFLYTPATFVKGFIIFGTEVAVGELAAVILGYYLCRILKKRLP